MDVQSRKKCNWAQVPSKRTVAKFVREHLCDRPIESLLKGAVSRCLIDD